MRPPGEVRQALYGAAVDLQAASWRDLAVAAQVGFREAAFTVKNMVKAGELVRVGHESRAGSAHWVGIYAPREPVPPDAGAAGEAMDSLTHVVRGWAAF